MTRDGARDGATTAARDGSANAGEAAGEAAGAAARLAGFSGLLPIAALACVVRFLLLLTTWPGDGTVSEAVGRSPEPPPATTTIVPDSALSGVPHPPARSPAGSTADAAAAIAPAAGPSPVTDGPAADSRALLAVAAELRQRRERVERREREVETREAALRVVEERLARQIDRLEGLRRDLDALLAKVSADEEARLSQLVKVYEAMKAKKAASIFDATEIGLLLPVVRRMRDAKVAAVIAEMEPAKARTLTAELARAREMPVLLPPTP